MKALRHSDGAIRTPNRYLRWRFFRPLLAEPVPRVCHDWAFCRILETVVHCESCNFGKGKKKKISSIKACQCLRWTDEFSLSIYLLSACYDDALTGRSIRRRFPITWHGWLFVSYGSTERDEGLYRQTSFIFTLWCAVRGIHLFGFYGRVRHQQSELIFIYLWNSMFMVIWLLVIFN